MTRARRYWAWVGEEAATEGGEAAAGGVTEAGGAAGACGGEATATGGRAGEAEIGAGDVAEAGRRGGAWVAEDVAAVGGGASLVRVSRVLRNVSQNCPSTAPRLAHWYTSLCVTM